MDDPTASTPLAVTVPMRKRRTILSTKNVFKMERLPPEDAPLSARSFYASGSAGPRRLSDSTKCVSHAYVSEISLLIHIQSDRTTITLKQLAL